MCIKRDIILYFYTSTTMYFCNNLKLFSVQRFNSLFNFLGTAVTTQKGFRISGSYNSNSLIFWHAYWVLNEKCRKWWILIRLSRPLLYSFFERGSCGYLARLDWSPDEKIMVVLRKLSGEWTAELKWTVRSTVTRNVNIAIFEICFQIMLWLIIVNFPDWCSSWVSHCYIIT